MDIQSIKQRFGIIGNAPALNFALEVAIQVAPTDLTVLITGESGVGKEAFSQIIHQLSPRKHNGFIAVNCGAIPEGTIDSELFGHEKGSFTGALDARKGYFETVNGGTIFLDEVGELPLGTQARLLRVLETKEYLRVGSSKVGKTDVRVIAATNVNLLEAVHQGKFREDLYYRLSTVPIKVPSLRERPEDIPLLFRKFCLDFSDRYKTKSVQLDDNARDTLIRYTFPGNVRELKNIAEQLSVLASQQLVGADELNRFIPDGHVGSNLPMLSPRNNSNNGFDFNTERELIYKFLFDMKNDLNDLKKVVATMAQGGLPASNNGNTPMVYGANNGATQQDNNNNSTPYVINEANKPLEVEETFSLADMEKQLIAKVMRKHKFRRKSAAQELGISERTLYRKMQEYNIPDKVV